MEAKHVACSTIVQEAVWFKRFIEDLKIVTNSSRPVIIHCDSQTTIYFTKDAKYHSKSKHIEIKYNFVREIVAQREVLIQYTSTHFIVADPFTKVITRYVYLKHTRSLGLCRL